VNVFAATVKDLRTHWCDFSPYLARFEIETGATSLEQFRAALLAEKQQLWGLQDSAGVHLVCVTEILDTPHGSVCHIQAAAGHASRKELRQLFDSIKGWAREIGCVLVRIVGRKGWRKLLSLRETGRVMECAL
jgi:hypothetical protein